MLKRSILMVLCFFMLLSAGTTALELAFTANAQDGDTTIEEDRESLSSLQNSLSNIKNNKEKLQELIEQTNMATQTMLQEKMLLEQEYALLAEEEEAITKIINEYDVIIKETAAEKDAAEKALDKKLDDFGALLVYMYMNGNDSHLELFLKSESYSEYLAKVEFMEHIVNSSNLMIKDIEANIAEITQKEEDYKLANEDLQTYKEELLATRDEKEQKAAELEAKIGENNELIEFTKDEIESLKDYEEGLREDISALQQQIEDKLAATYDGVFSFPLIGWSSYRITSRFGIRTDGPFVQYEHHNGMDFACARGTAIGAVDAGIVTYSGYRGAFGNVVFVEHGGGITTVYAHCDSLLVKAGDRVAKDQVIARVGTTGQSSGYHLHFAVLKNGGYVDPEEYLPSYYTKNYSYG